ncbi:MAG: hypothetical protein U0992_07570 [Planctomycetaceae bacterium]
MARDEQASKSTLKIVLIILVSGGLCLLLCCGGMFWWGKNMFQKVVISDPAAVKTRAAAIADISIPEVYQPQMAMDMSAVGVPMTMCMYFRPGGQSGVMLMEMSGPMAGDQEQMRRQFQQGMQQQGQNQQINISSTETRTYLIQGEKYDFEFVKGTRPQDNVAVRQVLGVIPGKTGAAFLMVFETEENWDEAAITGMIESMGAKLVEADDDAAAKEAAPGAEAAPKADEAAAPESPDESTRPTDGESTSKP